MVNIMNLVRTGTWEAKTRFLARVRAPWEALEFGGNSSDEAGFANVWSQAVAEDDERNDFLVMSPNFDGGVLRGRITAIDVPENARFRTSIGFLRDTPAGASALFEVWVIYEHEGRSIKNRLINCRKPRDGVLRSIEADMSFLSGKRIILEMSVKLIRGRARATLPIWSHPRIEEGDNAFAVPTRFIEISPVQLTVHERNESSGGGDDPMLAALYFRTVIGSAGSTVVEVMDLLSVLGENVDQGESIAIDSSAFLTIRDVGLQNENATLMTVAFIAVEEDIRGRGTVREKIAAIADALFRYLVRTSENNSPWVFADPARFVRGLKMAASSPALVSSDWEAFLELVETASEDGEGVDIGGGNTFREWIGQGHDLIGVETVSFLAGPLAPFVVLDAGGEFPILELVDQQTTMTFQGKGAVWDVTLDIAVVPPNYTLTGGSPPAIA